MVGIKALNNFPLNLLGRELEKCKIQKRAFFKWDSLKNTVLHNFNQKKIFTYFLSGRAGRKIFESTS